MRVEPRSLARRSPTLRYRPRRDGSARLAQEAEGAGGRLALKGNAENCLASAVLYGQVKGAITALIVRIQLSNH